MGDGSNPSVDQFIANFTALQFLSMWRIDGSSYSQQDGDLLLRKLKKKRGPKPLAVRNLDKEIKEKNRKQADEVR